jgi:hypothetical protein
VAQHGQEVLVLGVVGRGDEGARELGRAERPPVAHELEVDDVAAEGAPDLDRGRHLTVVAALHDEVQAQQPEPALAAQLA